MNTFTKSPGPITQQVIAMLSSGGTPKIPKKVLIIDDNEPDTMVLSSVLESIGCEVYSAGEATAGLDRVLSWRPADMIFVDLKLPGINGTDVMRILRLLFPKQPFCVYTGSVDLEELKAAEKYGCAILHKPFNTSEVVDIMNAI
jgi:CheY-like chemotaxis protein